MSSELQTREQLFAVMEQIAEEREAARPIVEELLTREPADLLDIEIPEEWRTAGFVQELSEAAGRLWQSNPLRSLPLQQIALSIAMSFSATTYPQPVQTRLEGIAWRQIGYVHLIQNAYDAAIVAIRAAEECFERDEILAYDAARTRLSHAYALVLMRRLDQTLQLIEQSISAFRTFGDDQFVARAQLAKAGVEQQRGNLQAAKAIYEKLLSAVPKIRDPETLGPVYHNLGLAFRDSGDLENAVVALERARDIFASVETPVERTDWILATVRLMMGEYDKALPVLYRVRNAFLTRGMPQDAGEVALDIVEALVASDQYAEARELTEQALKEFVAARLNDSAITALAYLRDLFPSRVGVRQAVQHVRSHLEQLRSEPLRVFVPIRDENS